MKMTGQNRTYAAAPGAKPPTLAEHNAEIAVLLMLDAAELHRRAIPVADMTAAIARLYRCRGHRVGWH
jgi:hypothetical protein